MYRIKLKDIKVILGGDLGQTSKMPFLSFGLSTDACKTGTKLQGTCGSVCEKCYARRLEKIRPSVRIGHERRTNAVNEACKSPSGQLKWVTAMVLRIHDKYLGVPEQDRYFRWHDSGDIQSVTHLHMLAVVASELPDIKFWVPTKEKKIVKEYLRKYGNFPDNLTVRVSSAMIDAAPLKGFDLTSTVHHLKAATGHECPAPSFGGYCGSCRACWSKEVPNVSYHKH